jgi:hypothetical protein
MKVKGNYFKIILFGYMGNEKIGQRESDSFSPQLSGEQGRTLPIAGSKNYVIYGKQGFFNLLFFFRGFYPLKEFKEDGAGCEDEILGNQFIQEGLNGRNSPEEINPYACVDEASEGFHVPSSLSARVLPSPAS